MAGEGQFQYISILNPGGLGGGGVTISASGGTITSGAFSLGTSPTVTFGITGNTITASAVGGGTGGTNYVFSNGNGVSFGTTGSTVTATVKTNYLTTAAQSNHSHGNPTLALTNLTGTTASNSAGFTLSLSAGAGGAADGYNAAQFTNSTANTTQAIVWAGNAGGSGNVTIGLTGSTVTMSAPSGAGGGAAISAGGASQNTGTIIFSNASGVSFGLNAGTLTASVRTDYQSSGAYLTTAMQSGEAHLQAIVYSNATQTSGTLVLSGSNGITVSSGNGTAIIAFDGHHLDAVIPSGNNAGTAFSSMTSGTVGLHFTGAISGSQNGNSLTLSVPSNYLTTAALSQDSSKYAGTVTGITGSIGLTANTSGVSVSIPAFLTTAANSTHSHGNPTLNLTNINGTTASASNGLTLSLSAVVPAQTVQPVAYSAANGSALFSTLSFPNSNGYGWSTGANGIYIASDPVGTVSAYAVGNTTQSTSGSIAENAISFSGAGIVSVGVSNGSVVISANAAGGTINQTGPNIADSAATITSGTVLFSNANGVSFGLAGSTMTASVAGGGATLSQWPNPMPSMGTVSVNVGTTTTVAGGSQTTASYRIWPIQLPAAVTFNDIDLLISANTVAGTGTCRAAYMLGLYTVNGGTRLDSLSTFAFGWSLNQNSVTAQSHTFWRGLDPAASSTGLTNSSVSVTGAKRVDIYDGAASLSAGLYYGVVAYTASSNGLLAVSMNNVYCLTQHTTGITTAGGYLGAATGATSPLYGFVGIFSSTSSTNSAHVNVLPATINTTAITNTGGSSQQYYPVIAIYRTGV